MLDVKEEFLNSVEYKELKAKFPDQLKELDLLIEGFFNSIEQKKQFSFLEKENDEKRKER